MKKNFKLTTLHINIIAFLFPLVALFKLLLKLFGRKTAVLWINLVLLLFRQFSIVYVDLLFSYFLFRMFADTKIYSVILFGTHLCSLCLLSGIFSFTFRLFYSHSSPLFVWLPSIGWFLALMLFFAYSSLCSFSRSVSVWEIVFKSHFYY